jgi:hypothetical protein
MDQDKIERLRAIRERIVARYEAATQCQSAGCYDALLDAILAELFDLDNPPRC